MSFTMLTLVTALGWLGAVAGLVAYGMVTRGRWSPSSLPFQVANMCGATLMFLVAAVNGVWPSAAANAAWILIGTQALVAIARAQRDARTRTTEEPQDGSADRSEHRAEPRPQPVTELGRGDEPAPATVDLAA